MEQDSHKRYVRRNFAVSTFLHVLLIGSALLLSAFVPTSPERPVWVELGDGQAPGSGGGGDDKEAGPAAPAPDEPAPPPPPSAQTTPPEVSEPAPSAPRPQIKPETPKPQPKPEVKQPETPIEPPKKIEKPKPHVKPQPKPEPQAKKVETKKPDSGKVEVSKKLVTRPKAGAQVSTTKGVPGGVKDGKGKTVNGNGKNFNASAFRSKMLNMVGDGPGGPGTSKGPGRGPKSGQGAGPSIGRYPGPGAGMGGLPSQFGWYYQMIKVRMDESWQQPSLQGHMSCVVFIRIQRDGTISNAWFDRKSGDVVMDESVLSAVNTVRRIAPLPQGLGNGAYADIPVEFELKPQAKKG